MSRNRILVLAGVLVFVVVLVTTAPARLAAPALQAAGASARGLDGTLWSGQARSLTLMGLRLDQPSWRLQPLRLLRGEVAASTEAVLPGGFVRGEVFWQAGGMAGARGLEGAAPLAWLVPGTASLAGNSQLSLRVTSLEIKDGWIRTAVGTLDLGQVTLPLPTLRGKLPPGGYSVSFDARDLDGQQPVVGVLRDLGGPLEVTGQLQLRPPRDYELAGQVKPRPDTPADLTGALRTLGPRTPEGGYGFSLAGSF